jgi:hypothetical protein
MVSPYFGFSRKLNEGGGVSDADAPLEAFDMNIIL